MRRPVYKLSLSTTYSPNARRGSDGELLVLGMREGIRTQCGSHIGEEGCRCLTDCVRIRLQGRWRRARLHLDLDPMFMHRRVLTVCFSDGLSSSPNEQQLDAAAVRLLLREGSLELAYPTRTLATSLVNTPGRMRRCQRTVRTFNHGDYYAGVHMLCDE